MPHAESVVHPAALALRLHRVDGGAELARFDADTKTNTSTAFLKKLFALGLETADGWLQEHRRDLGRRSSCSLPPGVDS